MEGDLTKMDAPWKTLSIQMWDNINDDFVKGYLHLINIGEHSFFYHTSTLRMLIDASKPKETTNDLDERMRVTNEELIVVMKRQREEINGIRETLATQNKYIFALERWRDQLRKENDRLVTSLPPPEVDLESMK